MPRDLLVAVIDDDDPFRTALAEMLDSLGHRVSDFASAGELIAATKKEPCDCIIADIHMPGMSGFDLKRLLTARDCKVPVIMITARTEPELEARAAACGALGLLGKPFEADTLINCRERAANR